MGLSSGLQESYVLRFPKGLGPLGQLLRVVFGELGGFFCRGSMHPSSQMDPDTNKGASIITYTILAGGFLIDPLGSLGVWKGIGRCCACETPVADWTHIRFLSSTLLPFCFWGSRIKPNSRKRVPCYNGLVRNLVLVFARCRLQPGRIRSSVSRLYSLGCSPQGPST